MSFSTDIILTPLRGSACRTVPSAGSGKIASYIRKGDRLLQPSNYPITRASWTGAVSFL